MIVWIKTVVQMTEEDQKQQGRERKQQSGESLTPPHSRAMKGSHQSPESELKTRRDLNSRDHTLYQITQLASPKFFE
jgi:hypothetical protein